MKMDGKDSVAIATIGDAAARQGEFYEAWAFAVQEKLPVIFILEDNKYGISTPTEKFMPFHLPLFDSEAIVKVDGRRPDDILEAGRTAIDKARKGDGPTMIWLDLDRLSSHTSSDDHRVYRDLNEIEEMQHRDPIRLLSEELLKSGALTEAAFQAMQDEVFKLVDEDYIAAEKADDDQPAAAGQRLDAELRGAVGADEVDGRAELGDACH
jgi:2-oxoisovalerate dehydrogenase E1 component